MTHLCVPLFLSPFGFGLVAATGTLALKRVTLFKNNLVHFERAANLSSGVSVSGSQLFTVSVPKTEKALMVDTLSVQAPEGVSITVNYDAVPPAEDDRVFNFRLVDSYAKFLASCVGAEVVVVPADGPSLNGTVNTFGLVRNDVQVICCVQSLCCWVD